MHILITGGAGFIGSHLCDRLLVDGHEVIAMDNLSTGSVDNIAQLAGHERFHFIKHDVTNYIFVEGPLDAVFHLAAWVQISPWGGDLARRTNVEGTRNVCSAALDLGVRRLVHTSSIATIGAGTLADPATESTRWKAYNSIRNVSMINILLGL